MLETFLETFSLWSLLLGGLIGAVVSFRWGPNAGGNHSVDVNLYVVQDEEKEEEQEENIVIVEEKVNTEG